MDSEQLYLDGMEPEPDIGSRDLFLGTLPKELRVEYSRIKGMESGKERNFAVTLFNQRITELFPQTSGAVYDIRRNFEVVIAKLYICEN